MNCDKIVRSMPLQDGVLLIENSKRFDNLYLNQVEVNYLDSTVCIGNYVSGNSKVSEKLFCNKDAVAIVYYSSDNDYYVATLFDINSRTFITDDIDNQYRVYFDCCNKVKKHV